MTKDELKRQVDLVALVERAGVTLHQKGDEWIGRCPLHDDTKASLSVNQSKGQWKCFGCGKAGDCFDWIAILHHTDFKGAYAELQQQYGSTQASTPTTKPIAKTTTKTTPKTASATTWNITDAAGTVIAQHVRYDSPDGSKSYGWKRDGKDGLNGLKTADLPLYGMESLRAAPPGARVTICEGEKAADALIGAGYTAMGTVTGASSCPLVDAFKPLIGSERVYLWPDNDAPGYAHMTKVAEKLGALNIEPYLIRWPEAPPKADAFDFLARNGDLQSLYANALPWLPGSPAVETVTGDDSVERRIKLMSSHTLRIRAENVRRERTGVHARITILLDEAVLSWDVFNVERSEERGRLAKSAYQRLPEGIDNLCGLEDLKAHLDSFASSLWDSAVDKDMPGLVTPSETIEKIEFYAEPFVVRGGGTILFAPPGFGKSYVCLLLAVSMDAGVNSLWPVRKARALFINLERSEESVKRRLAVVNRALGLPVNRPLLMLNRRGHALADIAEAVRKAIRQLRVDAIFLDSISRFGSGDLNENATANRMIDTLSSLCPTWLALAHTPRADETHAFGSVHFEAGADLMVRLSSERKGSDLGIGLSITKSNDVPHGQMRCYCLSFKDSQLAAVRVANPGEFGELALAKKRSLTQEIAEYLMEEHTATTTQIANGIGRNRSNVSTVLNESEEFKKAGKAGKDQLWELRD